MQLIDRHALLKNVYDNPPEKARMTHAEWCRKCIYEAPTIEVKPVQHGRWIKLPESCQADYECSECGAGIGTFKPPYCAICGAKMDGGSDND